MDTRVPIRELATIPLCCQGTHQHCLVNPYQGSTSRYVRLSRSYTSAMESSMSVSWCAQPTQARTTTAIPIRGSANPHARMPPSIQLTQALIDARYDALVDHSGTMIPPFALIYVRSVMLISPPVCAWQCAPSGRIHSGSLI